MVCPPRADREAIGDLQEVDRLAVGGDDRQRSSILIGSCCDDADSSICDEAGQIVARFVPEALVALGGIDPDEPHVGPGARHRHHQRITVDDLDDLSRI